MVSNRCNCDLCKRSRELDIILRTMRNHDLTQEADFIYDLYNHLVEVEEILHLKENKDKIKRIANEQESTE